MLMFEQLKSEVENIGKPTWRDMLAHMADLHEQATHPAREPFAYPWEDLGPGYHGGRVFGHWDIVHASLDTMNAEPQHARNQLLNNLAVQQDDGRLPGTINLNGEKADWNPKLCVPILWPVAVDDYAKLTGDTEIIARACDPLVKQIHWLEENRKADDGGFYYADITLRKWESGVDEGVRFDNAPTEPAGCVDATSHALMAYEYAADWSKRLGKDGQSFARKAQELGDLIRSKFFDAETGFFHDIWAVGQPGKRTLAFEGIWPVVAGAATVVQAERVINENLLNPERFFAKHAITTVGMSDPRFELRMWRGPVWNSMTYWATRGCRRYGRNDAARQILEHALDATSEEFKRTGAIWEFHHPHGGDPKELQRKFHLYENMPCRNYVGHNPVVAMTRLWESALEE
jgi:putative isomerase